MKTNLSRALLLALGTAALVAPPLRGQVVVSTCSDVGGTDCRSQIPDARSLGPSVAPGVLGSSLVIPPGSCPGPLLDVDLSYRFLHGHWAELAFQLLPPSGPALDVGSLDLPVGTFGDDLDLLQPVQRSSFPTLQNVPVDGTWTLRVTDGQNVNEGALDDWTLTLVCPAYPVTLPGVSVVASEPDAGESPLRTGAFTFTRTVVDGNALYVTFLLDGTATADDYEPVPLNVVIPPFEASATVFIDPIPDGIPEPTEYLVARLLDSPDYEPGRSAAASLTIADVSAAEVPSAGPAGLALLSIALGAAALAALRRRA